jgi:condensin complex subunit 1
VLFLQQAQGINAELGLGATVDIAIESLAERAEKEIVCCSSEKNLIGHCGPFLSKLCRNMTFLQKVNLLGFLYFFNICFH